MLWKPFGNENSSINWAFDSLTLEPDEAWTCGYLGRSVLVSGLSLYTTLMR